jgi:hypothetical protein
LAAVGTRACIGVSLRFGSAPAPFQEIKRGEH